uniref:DEAD/DEAH box helicase domain-containing protein (FANCM) n=1 Tax=uncultured marine thaumarchaeote KM3_11_C04 TaxID=1455990 RepID=A0A075GDJ3_9ARCH|nr:DEAD/DEAH box helicase domain-containing protein (FANCM) [uncultured marine thaumarchaeote KM3_11_C04]
MTKNVEHEFIVPDSIEARDYQINMAQQAKTENSLVVLPTGLGKTTIALHIIADYLSKRKGGILFLAPTRVLANQHYEFLKNTVRLDDITLITGEALLVKRKKLWINSIICATPEIVRNDIIRKIVDVNQFSLVIFDEAHRAVGDYAYVTIAEQLNIDNTRILGMTATLPSEKTKAKEICENLHIKGISERSDSSPDVKPYIQNTDTEWVKVDLSPEMKIIQRYIKLALDQRYIELRRNGLRLSDNKSLSQLLNARQFVLKQNRRSAKPLFTAIRITYALNIFEAHGITSFLKFCERTKIKKGAGIKELFETDPNFTTAINLAMDAQAKGIEHPKINKLGDILCNIESKVLIFSSYRDSVNVIHEKLTDMNIPAEILIGKAGDMGLKQKKQVETVQKFRDGITKVLVATRVGEEGLDISEVNLVIFYDNVPSSIRFVQRRGRTGRKESGRLVVLIAKDTIDEAYYWIGKRKIKSASDMAEKLSKHLEKTERVIDDFF